MTMMRRITVCLMCLCLAAAGHAAGGLEPASAGAEASLPLRAFVEQVLVPMALANDYEWRIVQAFSNEELGTLIEACEANGIALPEDGRLMKRYRGGESCDEESAITDVCATVFGDDFWEWRLADRQWLRSVMAGLGYDDWEQEPLPGPEDLTEDEARAILFAAMHEQFGDDIPFEDPEVFRIYLRIEADPEGEEDGWLWRLECRGRADGRRYIAGADRAGNNAYAYEPFSGHEPFRTDPPPETWSLTAEEAIRLAAEAVRAETGIEVPLEDPAVYSAAARPRTAIQDGLLYWDVTFPSHSRTWGFCRATVEDVSRAVRVSAADAGPITADNILKRYQNEFGFWGDWPLETWALLSEEIEGLPAETPEGRILSGTRYILPGEGLLTQLQADEIAFRAAGLTRADIYCVVLIDADPHPVWKFCLKTNYGYTVTGFTTVEVDAATGEVLHLEPWAYDADPAYCVYSLERP